MLINLSIFFTFLGGIIYLLNKNFPDVLEVRDNYLAILQAVIILVFLALGFFRRQLSASVIVRNITAWLGIFFVILSGYSYRYELQSFGERVKSNILPSHAEYKPDGSVTFRSSINGHFIINAQINGKDVNFLLDTGASIVTLSRRDAIRIGIDVDNLDYGIRVMTANGMNFVAYVVLPSIKVGDIVLENITAYVSRKGLDQSLLGMNFLKKIKRYEVHNGAITLWQ